MFDKEKSTEKALRLIEESAAHGAELVVFPELFIPGYPYGMTFGFTVGSRNPDGRKDWKNYYDNSLLADGEEMQKIVSCARKNHVYVSIGYSECDMQKVPASRMEHDVCGHYARPDILKLQVEEK